MARNRALWPQRLGNTSERGQSTTEFIIVFPLLLLLMLGIIQFSLIMIAKSTLDQAAYYGARAGILNNASRISINLAVADGLAPLYQKEMFSGGRSASTLGSARTDAELATLDPTTLSITIINPSALSFNDWGESMSGLLGTPHIGIPNSGLLYRDEGRGTFSQQTIQDANLLKIRVHYCYPLVVPFIRTVIEGFATSIYVPVLAFDSTCYASGGVSITADATMLMQTPAYEDSLIL